MPAIREDDLQKYQSEILFLLIGENPLPNYVAAKLLTKPFTDGSNPVIYLVHSKDTLEYAKNLDKVLNPDSTNQKFRCIKFEINPWEYFKIEKEIDTRLNKILETEEKKKLNPTIGLNYTGGTKAMSVHAYRAVKKRYEHGKFSYLDANAKFMRFDETTEGEGQNWIDISDVKSKAFDDAKISLEQLLALHGWEKYGHNSDNPRQNNRLKIVYDVLLNDALSKNYDSWDKFGKFREKIRKLTDNCKNDTNYRGTSRKYQTEYENCLKANTLNIQNLPQNLQKTFETEFNANGGKLNLANLPNKITVEDWCNFIKGTWLEDVVLEQFIELKDECNLQELGASLEIRIPKNREEIKFIEIDVVAIKGYQLFAVSCTLERQVIKGKQKLFEIAHRAKQLGGAEAKIGLVCLASEYDTEILNEQLKDDHIKVWGKSDLKNLKTKLRNWFNGE